MPPPITYRQYERRRLGNASGEWAGIVYMTGRAFGASTFAGFWRYWNPLFSYYLYFRCYRPLVRRLPRPAAVVLTFAASGAVHDLFASLAAMRLSLLCTSVFALFGLLVVLEERFSLNLDWAPPGVRALIHGSIIAGAFAAAVFVRAAIA